jgi:hypothetical protein
MLTWRGEPFTTGKAAFFDRIPDSQESTAKICVRIKFEGLATTHFAQVDTGAAWSMLGQEVAERLGVLDGDGEEVRISTRLGSIQGRLERVRTEMVADEGKSVEFDATFFVSRGWFGPTFLGYSGFLDRLRVAIDPSTDSVFFGLIASR